MVFFTSTIHCNNNFLFDSLIKISTSFGLTSKVCECNSEAIEISGEEKIHDSFLSLFENNNDFLIFYDHIHSKTQTGKFKTHFHIAVDGASPIAPTTEAVKSTTVAKTTTTPTTPMVVASAASYGRTATWFANYYKFPPPNTGAGAPIIAVISFGGGYNFSDLQYYWRTVCSLTKYPIVINCPIGQASVPKFSGSGEDFENTLDLEIVGACCPNATLLFISVPNTDLGFYQAFSSVVSGVKVIDPITRKQVTYFPTVISVSWGFTEVYSSSSSLNFFNNLFAQAAAKGITILAASGDTGSTDGYSYDRKPHVDFPASSAWVLAVGGTTIPITGTPETTWSWNSTYQWATGGGCSNTFAAPSWQNGIVKLPSTSTPSVSYLAGKRALPDVSLHGDPINGYTIYMGGKLYVNAIGGTSCSTPLTAALLGLMNFKYPISAANALYNVFRNPSQRTLCFNNIISGSNDNIPRSSQVWNATDGFDMCTGMGSINGTNLYTILSRMPELQRVVTTTVPSSPTVVVTPSSLITNEKEVKEEKEEKQASSKKISKKTIPPARAPTFIYNNTPTLTAAASLVVNPHRPILSQK